MKSNTDAVPQATTCSCDEVKGLVALWEEGSYRGPAATEMHKSLGTHGERKLPCREPVLQKGGGVLSGLCGC